MNSYEDLEGDKPFEVEAPEIDPIDLEQFAGRTLLIHPVTGRIIINALDKDELIEEANRIGWNDDLLILQVPDFDIDITKLTREEIAEICGDGEEF